MRGLQAPLMMCNAAWALPEIQLCQYLETLLMLLQFTAPGLKTSHSWQRTC